MLKFKKTNKRLATTLNTRNLPMFSKFIFKKQSDYFSYKDTLCTDDCILSLRWLFNTEFISAQSLAFTEKAYYQLFREQKFNWNQFYGKNFFFYKKEVPSSFLSNFSTVGAFNRFYLNSSSSKFFTFRRKFSRPDHLLFKEKTVARLVNSIKAESLYLVYSNNIKRPDIKNSKKIRKIEYNQIFGITNLLSLFSAYFMFKEILFANFFSLGIFFSKEKKFLSPFLEKNRIIFTGSANFRIFNYLDFLELNSVLHNFCSEVLYEKKNIFFFVQNLQRSKYILLLRGDIINFFCSNCEYSFFFKSNHFLKLSSFFMPSSNLSLLCVKYSVFTELINFQRKLTISNTNNELFFNKSIRFTRYFIKKFFFFLNFFFFFFYRLRGLIFYLIFFFKFIKILKMGFQFNFFWIKPCFLRKSITFNDFRRFYLNFNFLLITIFIFFLLLLLRLFIYEKKKWFLMKNKLLKKIVRVFYLKIFKNLANFKFLIIKDFFFFFYWFLFFKTFFIIFFFLREIHNFFFEIVYLNFFKFSVFKKISRVNKKFMPVHNSLLKIFFFNYWFFFKANSSFQFFNYFNSFLHNKFFNIMTICAYKVLIKLCIFYKINTLYDEILNFSRFFIRLRGVILIFEFFILFYLLVSFIYFIWLRNLNYLKRAFFLLGSIQVSFTLYFLKEFGFCTRQFDTIRCNLSTKDCGKGIFFLNYAYFIIRSKKFFFFSWQLYSSNPEDIILREIREFGWFSVNNYLVALLFFQFYGFYFDIEPDALLKFKFFGTNSFLDKNKIILKTRYDWFRRLTKLDVETDLMSRSFFVYNFYFFKLLVISSQNYELIYIFFKMTFYKESSIFFDFRAISGFFDVVVDFNKQSLDSEIKYYYFLKKKLLLVTWCILCDPWNIFVRIRSFIYEGFLRYHLSSVEDRIKGDFTYRCVFWWFCLSTYRHLIIYLKFFLNKFSQFFYNYYFCKYDLNHNFLFFLFKLGSFDIKDVINKKFFEKTYFFDKKIYKQLYFKIKEVDLKYNCLPKKKKGGELYFFIKERVKYFWAIDFDSVAKLFYKFSYKKIYRITKKRNLFIYSSFFSRISYFFCINLNFFEKCSINFISNLIETCLRLKLTYIFFLGIPKKKIYVNFKRKQVSIRLDIKLMYILNKIIWKLAIFEFKLFYLKYSRVQRFYQFLHVYQSYANFSLKTDIHVKTDKTSELLSSIINQKFLCINVILNKKFFNSYYLFLEDCVKESITNFYTKNKNFDKYQINLVFIRFFEEFSIYKITNPVDFFFGLYLVYIFKLFFFFHTNYLNNTFYWNFKIKQGLSGLARVSTDYKFKLKSKAISNISYTRPYDWVLENTNMNPILRFLNWSSLGFKFIFSLNFSNFLIFNTQNLKKDEKFFKFLLGCKIYLIFYELFYTRYVLRDSLTYNFTFLRIYNIFKTGSFYNSFFIFSQNLLLINTTFLGIFSIFYSDLSFYNLSENSNIRLELTQLKQIRISNLLNFKIERLFSGSTWHYLDVAFNRGTLNYIKYSQLNLSSRANLEYFLRAGVTSSHFNFFFFFSKLELLRTKIYFDDLLLKPNLPFNPKDKEQLSSDNHLFFDRISLSFLALNFADNTFGLSVVTDKLKNFTYEQHLFSSEYDLAYSNFFNFFDSITGIENYANISPLGSSLFYLNFLGNRGLFTFFNYFDYFMLVNFCEKFTTLCLKDYKFIFFLWKKKLANFFSFYFVDVFFFIENYSFFTQKTFFFLNKSLYSLQFSFFFFIEYVEFYRAEIFLWIVPKFLGKTTYLKKNNFFWDKLFFNYSINSKFFYNFSNKRYLRVKLYFLKDTFFFIFFKYLTSAKKVDLFFSLQIKLKNFFLVSAKREFILFRAFIIKNLIFLIKKKILILDKGLLSLPIGLLTYFYKLSKMDIPPSFKKVILKCFLMFF